MSKIKNSRSTERWVLCNSKFTISSCPFLSELKITTAGPSRGPPAHARVALYRAANDAARPSPDDAGLGPFGSRSLPRPLVARAPATTRTFNRGGCAELRFELRANTRAVSGFVLSRGEVPWRHGDRISPRWAGDRSLHPQCASTPGFFGLHAHARRYGAQGVAGDALEASRLRRLLR